MIRLHLPSGPKTLPRADVIRLRETAAAQAGCSSAARDLALILDRALAHERTVALRRGELQTLIHIAAEADMHELLTELEGGILPPHNEASTTAGPDGQASPGEVVQGAQHGARPDDA